MDDIKSLLAEWKKGHDEDWVYDMADDFFAGLSRGDLCSIMDMIENYGKKDTETE